MKKKNYKFKVGDRVQIKDWDELVRENIVDGRGNVVNKMTFCHFGKHMKHLCGRTAVIKEIRGNSIKLKKWSNDEGDICYTYETWMVKPYIPVTFQKGDIVKIRKDITLDELTKNHWNGCCSSTMDFLREAGIDDFNQEYEVIESYTEYAIIEEFVLPINNILFELVKRKEILDSTEKKYLSNVIKPFRDKVKYIEKFGMYDDLEFISITIHNLYEANEEINLPCFKKGTMYKGMELDKKYSLEELGL